jgi:hypothetical protein
LPEGSEDTVAKVNIVLDMSQYDTFLLCAQRYDYRYNWNLTPPIKKSQLDRGTLVHVGCEVYYQALSEGAIYSDAVTAALSEIRKGGVVNSDLEPEEVSRIMDVMEEYFDYWRTEDQNLQIVAVESPFIKEIFADDDLTINLAGKIDLVVNEKGYTKLPYDHKSYDRDFEVLRMTNQFRCYAWVLESNYLVVDRIGFQKTLKPFEKFKRPKLSYDPLVFEQWKRNVIANIFKYLDCVAEGYWPMNETSCDKYHRRCEYYEVCDSSGEQAKVFKLNANFKKIEPWDVTKVLRRATEVLKDEQLKNTSKEKGPIAVD